MKKATMVILVPIVSLTGNIPLVLEVDPVKLCKSSLVGIKSKLNFYRICNIIRGMILMEDPRRLVFC